MDALRASGDSPYGCEIVEDPSKEDSSEETQGGMMRPARLRALPADPYYRGPHRPVSISTRCSVAGWRRGRSTGVPCRRGFRVR